MVVYYNVGEFCKHFYMLFFTQNVLENLYIEILFIILTIDNVILLFYSTEKKDIEYFCFDFFLIGLNSIFYYSDVRVFFLIYVQYVISNL